MARERADVQLAQLARVPPEGPRWLYEIKYDGYRALAHREGTRVELVSRSGLRYGGLEAIREAVRSLGPRVLTLDGELCALDDEGRPRFELLQRAITHEDTSIVYFVFDVLAIDDRDVRALPLSERKRALESLVPRTDGGPLRRVVSHVGDGAGFLEATRSLGLEGLVAKRIDRPYRTGRNDDWRKVKTHARQEAVVVGFTPPEGTRVGLGALLLGVHDRSGALRYAGKVGTGIDDATLGALAHALEPVVVPRAPVLDAPRMREARWVRPQLVVEVRFTEWTSDGRMRHPVFVGLRADKVPSDVVKEVADS
ncbi:MAG: non-homologous end-joining DNA ligase [Deltaproteobacteria bacterium]|nr:non-homologous end-joining DNA ligase [Deltaproteobacteria bacterium]